MFTVAGYPLREMLLVLPIKGQATARIEYLADDVISGPVKVLDSRSGDTLVADVYRAGRYVYTGRAMLRSANALASAIPAQHYQGLTVDALASSALSAAGVTRDLSVRGSTKRLGYWSRPADPCSSELNALVRIAADGSTWRTNLDGSVRFGVDTWPELPDDFDAEILGEWPDERTVIVATERLKLIPGTIWRGISIDQVEYAFHEDSGMRATLWRA